MCVEYAVRAGRHLVGVVSAPGGSDSGDTGGVVVSAPMAVTI